MIKIVYLDSAAGTQMSLPVFQEMKPFLMEIYANPSSSYRFADIPKQAIKLARERCAKAINAEPEQIIFTSGATESNNLVMGQGVIISSKYEHPSMKIGFTTDDIQLEINKLQRVGANSIIVSHQFVNNETGTIFDVKRYADIAHASGCFFHTDATQAFSHVPIDVKDIDCDFLSLSGHKFHAPRGIGLLYVKAPDKFNSPIIGGGQERGLRSGTENTAGIVGLGKAMELYNYSPLANERMKTLKDTLLEHLKAKCPCEYRINAIDGLPTVDNIVNISFKGINGEALAILLDYQGYCVSQGSACHSASVEPSAVLKAINVPEDYIRGTIRVSFSKDNSVDEVISFVDCLVEKIKALQN